MNCTTLPHRPIHPPRYLRQIHVDRLPSWVKAGLGLWLVPAALSAAPSLAAERIIVTYGPLQRSIPIEAIETYVRDGEVEGILADYTNYLDDAALERLRNILSAEVNLGPVAVSQFLYTDQGEILLKRLGEVIRTESNLSGFYAIRAALILASADPEGLTPLNVLEKFPLNDIRIDLNAALQILSDLETLVRQTQNVVAAIDQQAALEANQTALNLVQLPDLRQRGNYSWRKNTIVLNDFNRNRSFPADVYIPSATLATPATASFPVIVISHGLGSDRESFAYLAQHLASHGFAVAVPEHPGSNAQQLQALISGIANEVTAPSEFVDRPLDIKYLLDQLQELAQNRAGEYGRLNLQQVGVLGQSFGGYTALALAGATINLQQLEQDCPPIDSLNLSLLLQCRATELPTSLPVLKDDRVKAIIAINPIGSSLMGQSALQAIDIPVMLVAGSADTVAPALPEQIRPFTWLATPNKYLLVVQGGTHFSTIDVPNPEAEIVPIPPELLGPDTSVARRYVNAVSTAFFETFVANQANYQAYLTTNYMQSISQPLLPLSLVRSFDPAQLAKAIDSKVDSEVDETPPEPAPTPSPL